MNLDVAIRSGDQLSPVERSHFAACFEQQFGHIPYVWATRPWRCIAYAGDDLVAHLGIVGRIVTVGGRVVEVGGIGAVMTHESSRRQGVATVLLERSARFIAEDLRAPFGLLICREEVSPFYAELGWKVVAGPTVFDQPNGKTTYPRRTMVLPLIGSDWPPGEIDLAGLPW